MFNKHDSVTANQINNLYITTSSKISEFLEYTDTLDDIENSINQENVMIDAFISDMKYKVKLYEDDENVQNRKIYSLNFSSLELDFLATQNPCYVDKIDKFITNNIITKKELNNLTISISDSSNGFPGNTHEVEYYKEKLIFKGEQMPNIKLSNLLDNNSMFEYEAFKVSKETKIQTQNLGFHYAEDVSYLTDEDSLNLTLRIDINEDSKCNMLVLSPYILNCVGYSYVDLLSIDIYNTKNEITHLINTPVAFKHTMTFMFEKNKYKYIEIKFKQSQSYETKIGHFYSEYNGIRFPTDKDTLKTLGFDYDINSKQIINPNSNSNIDVPALKYTLFNKPYDIEVLNAQRYLIGISNISLYNCSLEQENELISFPIKTNYDIKTITPQIVHNGLGNIALSLSFNESKKWFDVINNETYNISELVEKQDYKVNSFSYKIKFSQENNTYPVLYDFILFTKGSD